MLALLTGKLGIYLAIALAIGAFGGVMYYKGGVTPRAERDAVTASFKSFQAQTKVLGEAAQKAADARIATYKQAKEQTDHENAAVIASNASTIAKLRHDLTAARTGGSYLPPASTTSSRPDLACFDRPSLESALRDLMAGVRGLADEGTTATIDLDSAKSWAGKTLH